jgi:hypothetical protein
LHRAIIIIGNIFTVYCIKYTLCIKIFPIIIVVHHNIYILCYVLFLIYWENFEVRDCTSFSNVDLKYRLSFLGEEHKLRVLLWKMSDEPSITVELNSWIFYWLLKEESPFVFMYCRLDIYKRPFKKNRPGREYNGDSWANV